MNKYFRRFISPVLGAQLLLAFSLTVCSQEGQTPKQQQPDDVIRTSTTLVQTDAMVFDKKGQFVEGLKPEQFELKVNGQSIPISFLELVTTGSAEEETQLQAARRAQTAVPGVKPPTTITPPAGRSIFVFVDDLHLAPESFSRARKTLLNMIEKEITPNDRAVITAASGQLGPQKLTTDKAALKATVDKLGPRHGNKLSLERPPMSEFAAVAINRGDQTTLDYYVVQIVKFEPGSTREYAEQAVKARARGIIDQGSVVTNATLTGLESFIREITPVPGRKLLLFLSDGFIVENERSISFDRLNSTARQAARAGVVIYSLNAPGLITTGPDATDAYTDARLTRTAYSADTADQDALRILADNSGGRAFINNNDLNAGVRRALAETSRYYLLAWKPPAEMETGEKVKTIQLAVVGRPELKVQTRKMLAEAVSETLMASTSPVTAPVGLRSAPAAPPLSELQTALNGSPQRGIPASLVIVQRNIATATYAVTASLQIPTSGLSFADVDNKKSTTIEVAGTVVDNAGKEVHSFTRAIGVPADSTAVDLTRNLLFYNYDVVLPPGSYQIKLGVRDAKSKLIGTTTRSIEIPDLANGRLLMSSLMLNEQPADADEDTLAVKNESQKGLGQHFAVGSRLQVLTYVYNAKPIAANENEPDLKIDVKILQSGKAVLSPALRELILDNKSDGTSYPYAAEVPLNGLSAGEYVLQVTVTDVTTKTTTSQQTTFVVDNPGKQ